MTQFRTGVVRRSDILQNYISDGSVGGAAADQPAWASVCKSACRDNSCSAEAVAVGKWSVDEVCNFVAEIDDACKSFVEVRAPHNQSEQPTTAPASQTL